MASDKPVNFDFKDTERDIERWLEKHGIKEVLSSGQICIRGYDKAKELVLEAYFKEHAYEAEVLETMRQFEAILIELGEQELPLTRLRDDIELFKSGEKRKITNAPQKRTIDEKVFWEIIEQLQSYDSTEEKCTQLVNVLECFAAADIKRFAKILTEKNEACALIPAGLETEADQLAWCAAIAFENRSGLPLAIKAAKTKTKGKPWQEEKLESLYPILWKRYTSQEDNHQPLL